MQPGYRISPRDPSRGHLQKISPGGEDNMAAPVKKLLHIYETPEWGIFRRGPRKKRLLITDGNLASTLSYHPISILARTS